MFPANINNYNNRLRVIVAPLDWGLGHATRCVPVINELIYAGCEIFIAGEGAIINLLKQEFPDVNYLYLPGYKMKYSKFKDLFTLSLLLQSFKIKQVINFENKLLKDLIKENKIDLVISDNRFGLYHKTVPSVFITHQLAIQTGNELLNKLAQKINYGYINRFSECWVPDNNNGNCIGGKLPHPEKHPSIPVRYTGILSRMKSQDVELRFDHLFILSGPEPQRSIFEQIVLRISKGKNVAIVRGLPLTSKNIDQNGSAVFDHLPAVELNKLICSSRIIICRSGYSSIMDLVTLGKPAIFIPTPGQTEQEYLAQYLFEKKLFKYVSQDDLTEEIFSLEPFVPKVHGNNNLKRIVEDRLETIRH